MSGFKKKAFSLVKNALHMPGRASQLILDIQDLTTKVDSIQDKLSALETPKVTQKIIEELSFKVEAVEETLDKLVTRSVEPKVGEPASIDLPFPDWIPNWEDLIKQEPALWNNIRSKSGRGMKVLIANNCGANPVFDAAESLFGIALALRGADVHFLLCDGLPACIQASADQVSADEFRKNGPKSLCNSCIALGSAVFDGTGLPIHNLMDLVSELDKTDAKVLAQTVPYGDIREYLFEGLKIGENAYAGAVRFFAAGALENLALAEPILRRYLEAAIISTRGIQRLFERCDFDCVVMNSGIYVPNGIVAEVTRTRSRRLVVAAMAYKEKCFTLSHDNSWVYKMHDEPTSIWENLELTQVMQHQIMDYLSTRAEGKKDWFFAFHKDSVKNSEAIAKELQIDFSKPTVGMLTGIVWDAVLYYGGSAFDNITEWVLETVEYFSKRQDIQLVIRIHPGEAHTTTPTLETITGAIEKAFPVLPPNVFIVGPHSPINSYSLLNLCGAALIFGSTMGAELAAMGIPVIIAGQTWIRKKGIAFESDTKEGYFRILDKLPFPSFRLDPEMTARAQKYSYHYNFRCQIPISVMERRDGWPPIRVNVKRLSELLPGKDLGLDVICEGILENKPFIYPAEQLQTEFM